MATESPKAKRYNPVTSFGKTRRGTLYWLFEGLSPQDSLKFGLAGLCTAVFLGFILPKTFQWGHSNPALAFCGFGIAIAVISLMTGPKFVVSDNTRLILRIIAPPLLLVAGLSLTFILVSHVISINVSALKASAGIGGFSVLTAILLVVVIELSAVGFLRGLENEREVENHQIYRLRELAIYAVSGLIVVGLLLTVSKILAGAAFVATALLIGEHWKALSASDKSEDAVNPELALQRQAERQSRAASGKARGKQRLCVSEGEENEVWHVAVVGDSETTRVVNGTEYVIVPILCKPDQGVGISRKRYDGGNEVIERAPTCRNCIAALRAEPALEETKPRRKQATDDELRQAHDVATEAITAGEGSDIIRLSDDSAVLLLDSDEED